MSERRYRAADGVELAYRLVGPEAGTPVVLCHGLAAGGEQFGADALFLAERGFRVLVPDIRGHGRSGTQQPPTAADFSPLRLASDLLRGLDHAGLDRVHWVGNSLGGIVALAITGTAPGRLRSLATFGTAFRLDLPAPVAPAIPALYRVFGRRLTAGVTARMTTPNPAARVLIGRMLHGFDPHVGRAIAENVRRYDLRAEGRAFRGPVLLLRCGRDRAVNLALGSTLEAMAGHPDFEVVEIAEAGHCANLDAPDRVREELLRFWRRADRLA